LLSCTLPSCRDPPGLTRFPYTTLFRSERQARVLTLAELKEKLDAMEGVQFKQFNSITDYHSLMFDLGIIARRLRSASDRSKFYRDRKSTRLNSSHVKSSYAVFCLNKKS